MCEKVDILKPFMSPKRILKISSKIMYFQNKFSVASCQISFLSGPYRLRKSSDFDKDIRLSCKQTEFLAAKNENFSFLKN